MAKNIYVFVVCGSKEHIDTLHFSLKHLLAFSNNEILVLTDSSRNEVKVEHSQIIDIATPKEFNHHQASIYLKTGIYKFLPKGNLYCYLDTDVIAIDLKSDKIFNEFTSPISFAPDHCTVQHFSAYAVNCGCLNKCEDDRNLFFEILKKQDRNVTPVDFKTQKVRKTLERKISEIQNSFLDKVIYAIRYYLSFPKFWLNKDIYYNKANKTWHLKNGKIIKYEIDVKSLAKEANLKYTMWFNKWKNHKGENIFEFDCNHLTAAIYETFGIEVKEKKWQHWNGGVFLFDDSSHDFLEAWHSKTVEIFKNKKWKTRDQGTLIATAWEFGLQNHPTLSKEWNFIADFHNNKLALSQKSNTITDDLFQTSYQPKFIHIFHEWGNENWEVWKWVKSKKTQ